MAASTEQLSNLYEMVLDNIPSSILLIDVKMQIVSTNRNFLDKSRLTSCQVIGHRLEEVFPPPIYAQLNLRDRVAEVFRTGETPERARFIYRAPGLGARTYVYGLVPFPCETDCQNVILTMDDITDLIRLVDGARKAERHLASVVESANDIVVSMDPFGGILTWNTAAVRITGYPESELQNRNLCELCQESQISQMMGTLERVRCDNGTEFAEVQLVNRDGHLVPISWTFSTMRDTQLQVIGMVAIGRDLTERHKFEAKLIQTDKLAALGVMAGGIAHEIRNPLAVVSSAAQLLLKDPYSRQVQLECAEHIYRGTQRVAQIVESLLRFARPADEGRMGRIDLSALIQDAVLLIHNQAKVARIKIQTNYAEFPVMVHGNLGLLQQVTANLLLNAINAMSEKGGEIALSVTQSAEVAFVRITDSGRGISGALLSKVFDPFYTTMPVGQGTGLGLSICYSIVQQHGGTIEISSQEGVGTSVLITLPLATDAPSQTSINPAELD